MCTLIKPIFRLTVVTFIGAMLMPITWAGPDCSDPKHAGNPNCPPPDDPPPSVTYTVGLTGRVFHFDFPVKVTPNAKENALFPDAGETLIFSRPEDPAARVAWDAVFASCENFFGPNPLSMGPTPIVVSGFTVPAGNWTINRAGGVRLVMSDILFDILGNSPPTGDPYSKVTLKLIGHTFFDGPDAPWLPTGNIEYDMIDSWIHGGTVKGVRPRESCVSRGGTEVTDFDPGQVRKLKIGAN